MATNPNKKSPKSETLITIGIIIIGSAFISISTIVFLNPLKLYASGVTGIAQIILQAISIAIYGKADWNHLEGYIGILNFIFLLPFNVLAWFKLSKKYAIYTTISSVVQLIVMSLAPVLSNLQIFVINGERDIMASVIIASIAAGVGNGILMRRGATSGGVVTLCQYLNLKNGKSVGFINFVFCAVILLFGAAVSFSTASSDAAVSEAISTSLYTTILFIFSSVVLDLVHTSYNKVKLEIITEKGSEITEKLISEFPHGVTISKGVGAYSKREKDILNVIIQQHEISYYTNIVKEADPDAFISVLPASRVIGRFTTRVIDK